LSALLALLDKKPRPFLGRVHDSLHVTHLTTFRQCFSAPCAHDELHIINRAPEIVNMPTAAVPVLPRPLVEPPIASAAQVDW
jgi:hypothetical protein